LEIFIERQFGSPVGTSVKADGRCSSHNFVKG